MKFNLKSLFIIILGIVLIGGLAYTVKFVYDSFSGKNKQIETKHAAKFFKTQDLSITKAQIHASLPHDSAAIVFLGTSLTEYFPVTELSKNWHVKNRGISGNFIKDIQFRIDSVTVLKPKVMFIEAGINDINLGNDPTTVFNEYRNLVDNILKQTPNTKVILQSLLPTRDKYVWSNKNISELNRLIFNYSQEKKLDYIDLYKQFAENGQMKEDLTADGLHISAKGYLLWFKQVSSFIQP